MNWAVTVRTRWPYGLPAGRAGREALPMSFRTLGLACAIASSGCLSSSEAGLPPSEPASPQTQLSQRDECAAACQAKYDRCSDDSAKERSEPHTNCYEDLRDCAQKCE